MGFVFGVERQAPSLEKALEGAGVGDKLNVRVPASEIYGERDPQLIKEIPKDGLIKQRVKPGQYYRQMKKGCLVSFKILEVRPKTVLADFNEPMAGIAVSMDVEVLDVRAASQEEIKAAREAYLKKKIGCG
jgi:FKBP-type peptidyl-prolyl cis-trans isomerase SlyD